MDAEEYRAILKRLGFTQAKAAEVLQINERTSRRYALGEPIPHWVGPVLMAHSAPETKRKGRPVRKK